MTTVGQVTYIAEIDTRKLASDAKDVERAVANTGSNIESVGRKSFSAFASNASTAFGNVADAIAGLAKVAAGLFIGGAFGAGIFIKQAADLQSVKASFESMTGSAEKANSVLQQLNKFSFETAFSSADINKAAQLLLGAGVRVENLGKFMKQIGDIAGATGADLGQLTLPLSQALARGKLQTQDFYQILNSGAGTFRKVLEEEVVKRGLGNLQDALANGTITTEVLTAALEESNKKGGFAFEGAIKQSKTFAGQMSNLQETIGIVALKVLGVNKATGEVDPNGLFAKMSKAVQDATEWLNKNKDAIANVGRVIIDNAIPAIAGLAAAFVVAKTAAIIFGIVAGVAAGTISLPFLLVATVISALVAAVVFLQVKFGLFTKVFDNVKKALQPLIDGFTKYLWPVLQQIGKFIGDVFVFAWKQLVDAFDKVKKALDPFLPQLKILGIVIGVALVAPLIILVGAIVAVVTAVALISAGVAWLINKFVDFGKAVGDAISSVIKWFGEAWANVSKFFNDVAKVISDFVTGIINFFTPIATAIGTVFSTIFQIISGIFIAIVAILAIAAQWVFQTFIQPVVNFFVDMFNTIVDGVSGFIQNVITFFTPIVGWINNNIIKPVANFFTTLWNGISTGVANAIKTVQVVFNTVVGWIKQNIIDPIAGFFNGLWKGITDGINGAVKGIQTVFNTIIGIIKTPINAIIDAINGVIAGINKLKVPDWVPGLGGASPNIPKIPKLAEGGIVTSPTLAMIGEGRGPEAVIPLSKLDTILEKAVAKAGNNGGVTQIVYPKSDIDLRAASRELAYNISKG